MSGVPTTKSVSPDQLPADVSGEQHTVSTEVGEKGSFNLLSQLKPQQVDWLWQDRIPLGEMTILDGDPSTNKSSLTIDLAARVSSGTDMPDKTKGCDGGVVILQGEDSVRKTLLLRAKAAGAKLGRIAVIEHADIPDDIDQVEMAVKEVKARLIVIDPLMCFLMHNANKEQAVRQALVRLRQTAERYNLAVVLVRHLSKNGGRNALYRGTGSIAITAAARSAFLVAPSPRDPHMRVLYHCKSNLGPITPSLQFEPVAVEDGGVRIAWRGECEYSASDLFGVPRRDQWTRDEAKWFLREILADGPKEQHIVLERGAARGLSQRTVERAKVDLGVESHRKGFGPGSTVYWSFPKSEPNATSQPHTTPTTPLAVYDPQGRLQIDTSHDEWVEDT